MKVLKRIAAVIGVLLGCVCLAALGALALNYRPGDVMGKHLDGAALESVEGGSVRLADYAGRVTLVAFVMNG